MMTETADFLHSLVSKQIDSHAQMSYSEFTVNISQFPQKENQGVTFFFH